MSSVGNIIAHVISYIFCAKSASPLAVSPMNQDFGVTEPKKPNRQTRQPFHSCSLRPDHPAERNQRRWQWRRSFVFSSVLQQLWLGMGWLHWQWLLVAWLLIPSVPLVLVHRNPFVIILCSTAEQREYPYKLYVPQSEAAEGATCSFLCWFFVCRFLHHLFLLLRLLWMAGCWNWRPSTQPIFGYSLPCPRSSL